PGNPVERAIYSDQIAQLRERQEQKKSAELRAQSAGQSLGSAVLGAAGRGPGMAMPPQSAGQSMAAAPSNSMMAPNADMGPPPPPDMMPMTAAAPAPPPIEETEKKLYAVLGATK